MHYRLKNQLRLNVSHTGKVLVLLRGGNKTKVMGELYVFFSLLIILVKSSLRVKSSSRTSTTLSMTAGLICQPLLSKRLFSYDHWMEQTVACRCSDSVEIGSGGIVAHINMQFIATSL